MPTIIEITDLSAPELAVYTKLTEAQLRNKLEPEKGIFIAESPKVIGTALDAGCLFNGAPAHRRLGCRRAGPLPGHARLHRSA